MGEMDYNYKNKKLKQYLINILYDQIYIELQRIISKAHDSNSVSIK